MKKQLVILLFLLAGFVTQAGNADLQRARELYYKATTGMKQAEIFSGFLEAAPDLEESLLRGYRGMCLMIMAGHSWNPYDKLSLFIKGRELLESAIKKDPGNMELRFLRFCVQTNAPFFLDYSGQITADKQVILTAYASSADADLKDRVKRYLTGCKYCSAPEKATLQ